METREKLFLELANDLVERYELSTKFINKMIDAYHLNDCEQILGGLDKVSKLMLILNCAGFNIFSGSGDLVKDLRKHIIDKWDINVINHHFEKRGKEQGKSKVHRVRVLAEQKWSNGKYWANTFVKESGFNALFAGVKRDRNTQLNAYEDIDPFIKAPDLKDFQVYIKDKIIDNLNNLGDNAKCMISLPTGGGKTRTAVEAYTEWLRPRFSEGKYLIWIAQSEELCEQAIASIKQIWSSKEFSESLRVYRLFGKHNLDSDSMIGGVIVAGINKLYNLVGSNDAELIEEIFANCGAMIIDEAHRSTTMMYETVLAKAKDIRGENIFPVCGLTATPGRTSNTDELSLLFKLKLITPDLGEEFKSSPLKYFRKNGFLAKPIPHIIRTDIEIDIKEFSHNSDLSDIKDKLEDIFKNKYNKELAKNAQRNRLIISKLLQVPRGSQALVYACTVDHAKLLSSIISYYGRTSVVISSDTPNHLRYIYIDKFKKGEIDFIFNHSVLTTGFDAPKTQHIFLCRPIFSDVLYEQIVGRGLRGPKFGGTPTCDIYDFSDTVLRFGDQQSYYRYKSFWEGEE
ncbi:MAG: DEAD/DEAH box helicase family protein [Bacteroidales bacterium]|nr:DEAD/DEAH box helicase family protein [Bacteroidales bacterium]